ncbi:MAG: hypothetical protein LBL35_03580 [Clostridiales bacterium]|jgi:hypothetical protein|nr:hypothetical protein [Clostridiales bacterium]
MDSSALLLILALSGGNLCADNLTTLLLLLSLGGGKPKCGGGYSAYEAVGAK